MFLQPRHRYRTFNYTLYLHVLPAKSSLQNPLVSELSRKHKMHSHGAHFFCLEVSFQREAEVEAGGVVFTDLLADAEANAGQIVVDRRTLSVHINTAIVEEGKAVGISMADRHLVFGAEGETAVTAQVVFFVPADAVHTADVVLAGTDHAINRTPLGVSTNGKHPTRGIGFLIQSIEFIEMEMLTGCFGSPRLAIAFAHNEAVFTIQHVGISIIGQSQSEGYIPHGVVDDVKSLIYYMALFISWLKITLRVLMVVIQRQFDAFLFIHHQRMGEADGKRIGMAFHHIFVGPIDGFHGVGAIEEIHLRAATAKVVAVGGIGRPGAFADHGAHA